MAKVFQLTYRQDDLSILETSSNMSYPVKKKGAAGALGQLLSRRFVVFDQDGHQLFQVVDGNSGTYPRTSLIINDKELFVLTAGGKHFATQCLVHGQQVSISGDPFSASFSLVPEHGAPIEVSAEKGGGKTVYRCSIDDEPSTLAVLSLLCAIAVFRGRIIPCLEA